MTDVLQRASEEDLAEYKAAETALLNAIVERSRSFLGYGLMALIAYPFAAYGPGWIHWIAGFWIAILLIGEIGMVGELRKLQQHRWPFRADNIMRNHYGLAAIAILALTYSLLGLWGRWPVPWLPLLLGVVINLVHGFGYGPPKVDG